MAQPEFVPSPDPAELLVGERVPPAKRWLADRPGEVVTTGGQPEGAGFGAIGPDQGYALRLARAFTDRVELVTGEHKADVVAGCVAVAMRRSALFGAAPSSTTSISRSASGGFSAALRPSSCGCGRRCSRRRRRATGRAAVWPKPSPRTPFASPQPQRAPDSSTGRTSSRSNRPEWRCSVAFCTSGGAQCAFIVTGHRQWGANATEHRH